MCEEVIGYLRHRLAIAKTQADKPYDLEEIEAEFRRQMEELNDTYRPDYPNGDRRRFILELEISKNRERRDEVLRTVRKLETEYLMPLAEKYIVPRPEDEDCWERYSHSGEQMETLSVKGISWLRQGIRRERNDQFVSLQSRLALLLAIASLIISLVKL